MMGKDLGMTVVPMECLISSQVIFHVSRRINCRSLLPLFHIISPLHVSSRFTNIRMNLDTYIKNINTNYVFKTQIENDLQCKSEVRSN